MKRILAYKRIYLIGLIPISYLLVMLAKSCSFFAEQIYAKHIYRWISQLISFLTGLIPISLAEVLVFGLPIVAIILILRFTLNMIFDHENRRERFVKGILNLIGTLSVALFLFTLLAGLNYYRDSFSVYSNLELRESSIDDLYRLTKSLALEANELRAQVPSTDEEGVFQLSESYYALAKEADQAFTKLAKEYPILGGYYGAPKPVFLSKLMSSTEITGIFFPFTMEANVNVDIPDYNIPVTMLHELAHLRGFMREDEANYLAYLAGSEADNIELQYSSTMLALVISGNALYQQDKELYFQIRDQYSEGVRKDLSANSAYWQKYEDTVVSTVSNKLNDTYLKANAQADGVKSYGRMLDLLLAKYRKDHGLE